MTKKQKVLFLIIIVVLIIFFFPKKSGTWMVSRNDDYYCKCLGYEHIFGSLQNLKKPGNSLCFGVPYSCGDAGLDFYWGN